jgi:hypothetical protein
MIEQVGGLLDTTTMDDADSGADDSSTMSRVFVWEQPPNPIATADRGRKTSVYWAEVASILADNTGSWAKVAQVDTLGKAAGLSTRIRTGHSSAFRPKGHFEAVYRTTNVDESGAKEYGVWARHVGEPQESQESQESQEEATSTNGEYAGSVGDELA